MKVNCLKKNPCVEKYYSEMTKKQKLAEIDDCLKSIAKILENLMEEKLKLLKG